jgi:hypothetical protein
VDIGKLCSQNLIKSRTAEFTAARHVQIADSMGLFDRRSFVDRNADHGGGESAVIFITAVGSRYAVLASKQLGVTSVATPLLSVPVPSEVLPLKKVTVPVGLAAVPLTVAVSVTEAPRR